LLAQEANFAEAKIAEERYEWVRASALYQEILDSELETFSEEASEFPTAEYEKVVNCFVHASFQSSDLEQFRERIGLAIDLCERARHESLTISSSHIPSYFRARALLLDSWIADSPESRREILNQCLTAAIETIEPWGQFENRHTDLLKIGRAHV